MQTVQVLVHTTTNDGRDIRFTTNMLLGDGVNEPALLLERPHGQPPTPPTSREVIAFVWDRGRWIPTEEFHNTRTR